MKHLLLTMMTVAIAIMAQAQFHYDFSSKKEAYVPLTGAISLMDTNTWDEENIKIPVGFSFKMNEQQLDSIAMSVFQVWGNDTFDLTGPASNISFSGFIFMNADLHDRADTTAAAERGVSPVRYLVSGKEPNRVFKLEFFNAGFADEYLNNGTSNDSLNLQIWVYEGSNDIEFRFGSNYMNDDYFQLGGFVPFMYANKLKANGTVEEMYYLHGDPSAPDLDSTTDLSSISALDSYPDSGMVYRFATKPVSVNKIVNHDNVKVYPTVSDSKIFIKNEEQKDVLYNVVAVNGVNTHMNGRVNGNTTTTLDVSNLPSGNYIIQMNSREGRSSVQFVKL